MGTNASSRSIDVPGGSLEVTIGRQPPTVWAAHPADTFGAAVVDLLEQASGAGVACVNPRGCGASPPPPRRQTIEDMADDVDHVRRGLSAERVVFWGMSGGGWLGLALAHRHPDAVAGLVLESVCASFRARLADPACVLSPFHAPWRAPLEARGLIDAASHERVGDPDDTVWEDVDGVGAVLRRRSGAALLVAPFPIDARMREVMPSLWAFDARPWLASLRVPTLVVCRTADPVVPTSHARALAEGLGGTYLAIDGAGHVPVTAGRAEVAVAVRAFLARLPADRAG